jgi:hypothetical protein
MEVLANSTDVTTYFKLRLAADGTAATGLTITDLDLQYVRSGATPAAKVDATALAAANSAHGDNQAIEVDATDQPALYRVDWPDAAFASGVREVILTVKHASIFTEELRVNLTPVPVDVRQYAGSTTDVSTMPASLASALADTNELQTDWANGGRLDLIIDATLADTNELQTDWVNGGRLDLILDATATASALASLVTTVGVAGAGLTAADDAVIAAIAALNNVSTAQVQTAAAAALTAYDPPTNAEMEARTLVAANYFDPAADTVANVTTVGSVTTKTGYALTSDYDFAKGTVAVTEAYAADGAAPTPVQALMLIQQALTEVAISSTTMTIKKIDGSTTAATLTLNDASAPTSKTRAT